MFTVLDQIRPTFNMLYMVSLTKELIFLSLKIEILCEMGARNPGQLRLNFGMAILIDSDYLWAKTRRQSVAIWPQNQR